VPAELLYPLARPGAKAVPGGVQAAGGRRHSQRRFKRLAVRDTGAQRGEHRVAGATRLKRLDARADELQVTPAIAVEHERRMLGAGEQDRARTGLVKVKSGPDGAPYAFDLDYCKGCGICATECPCGAIEMIPEEV
jgi:ferredoxin